MKTVGELKEFIKNLPDDMLLVNSRNHMEMSGYKNNVVFDIANMKKVIRETWDRFDGTTYHYECMIMSEDGIPCLKID